MIREFSPNTGIKAVLGMSIVEVTANVDGVKVFFKDDTHLRRIIASS